MKRTHYLGLFAAALMLVPAAAAMASHEDTYPPVTEISTPDGSFMVASQDAVEGTSRDDMSGIYNVLVDFCPADGAGECNQTEDFGSNCDSGCPLTYDWRVTVPADLPSGQYIVNAHAVDDAGNMETEGPSILVTVY